MRLLPKLSIRLPPPTTSLRACLWYAPAAVLFVSLLSLPAFIAVDDVDASWAQMLAHRAAAGDHSTIIFPYGPLFDLVVNPFDSRLFWRKFVLELTGKAILTFVLVQYARERRLGLLWLLAAAALNLMIPMSLELYLLGAALLMIRLCEPEATRRRIIFTSICLAALSLSKFTAMTYSAAGLAVVSLQMLSAHSSRNALTLLGGFAVAFAALFLLQGESLRDLPSYLKNGMAYSSIYADGLSLEGPAREVRLALAILALMLAAVTTGRKCTRIAPLVIIALLLALYWKAGFLRHDAHALFFFAVAFLTLLPTASMLQLNRQSTSCLILSAALSLLGFVWVVDREKLNHIASPVRIPEVWNTNLDGLRHPSKRLKELEAQRALLAEQHDLPRMRAVIGDETIDVYCDCHGVALLNGFRISSRITLQSANAVSADWMHLNAERLRSSQAPRYLLVKWFSVDNRYPTLTEGPALLAMLDCYELLLEEKGYLLLGKRPQPLIRQSANVYSRMCKIDETIELPPSDSLRSAVVTINLTSFGKLRSLAYQSPILFFLVRDDSGEWHPYRITTQMAKAGFLLDPLCKDQEELQALFEGKAGRRITAVRVHVMKIQKRFVESKYELQVTSLR